MKFKYIFFQINLYFKRKKYSCVYYWKNLKLTLILSFGENLNKISNIKNGVFCNVLNEVS
jgi:hypothetical protein